MMAARKTTANYENDCFSSMMKSLRKKAVEKSRFVFSKSTIDLSKVEMFIDQPMSVENASGDSSSEPKVVPESTCNQNETSNSFKTGTSRQRGIWDVDEDASTADFRCKVEEPTVLRTATTPISSYKFVKDLPPRFRKASTTDVLPAENGRVRPTRWTTTDHRALPPTKATNGICSESCGREKKTHFLSKSIDLSNVKNFVDQPMSVENASGDSLSEPKVVLKSAYNQNEISNSFKTGTSRQRGIWDVDEDPSTADVRCKVEEPTLLRTATTPISSSKFVKDLPPRFRKASTTDVLPAENGRVRPTRWTTTDHRARPPPTNVPKQGHSRLKHDAVRPRGTSAHNPTSVSRSPPVGLCADFPTKRKRDHTLSTSLKNLNPRAETGEHASKKWTQREPRLAPILSPDSELSFVSIKLEDKDKFCEISTNQLDLARLKRKSPRLTEVVPEVGAQNIEIECSLPAAELILKFLFKPFLNPTLPNGRIVIEALAMALRWELQEFRTKMLTHFLQKVLSAQKASDFYNLADHLGDHQLCDAIEQEAKKLSGGTTIVKSPAKFSQKTCLVVCLPFEDPSEYEIPLGPATGGFQDSFCQNIKSTLSLQPTSGTFAITGFAMFFVVDGEAKELPKIGIDYHLENKSEGSTDGDKKEKCLRETVILYLKKDFLVRQGQKCTLEVEIDIKPDSCYVLNDASLEYASAHGKFRLDLKSNYREKGDKKFRFFIKKLFYREVN